MSDAAEVLGAIYDSLRTVEGGAALVDAVFGLHVAERVHCNACGKDTHANAYTQFFYNAPATALRLQARRISCLQTSGCFPAGARCACSCMTHCCSVEPGQSCSPVIVSAC